MWSKVGHYKQRAAAIGAFGMVVLIAAAGFAPASAAVRAPEALRADILDVAMVGRSLRVTMATAGLGGSQGDAATADVSVWLNGVAIRVGLPLIHMPRHFSMDLDLAAGVARVGGITVGQFASVPPFRENLRFPVEVTVRRGTLAATARRTATILLPAVIVPGYLNEHDGPSAAVLTAFRRHGYADSGAGQNVFWFTYKSTEITLPEGGQALAAYVRRTVLPASYAARINVVGYSLGGLMARWNVAYDVDGWGALINRLMLVGVPNEGTVLAYLTDHTPSALPYSSLGRTSASRAFMPTFPFWRAASTQPWGMPPDAENTVLDELNARPIPPDIRVYLFYGSHDPHNSGGPQTSVGITGMLPGAELAFGAGDGMVLAASAQGLPILGGIGVPALAERAVLRVDLGPVYHTRLLDAAAGRIAGALLDRFVDHVDE
ncbi:MAG: esterase/lipase family protein [bacterium]